MTVEMHWENPQETLLRLSFPPQWELSTFVDTMLHTLRLIKQRSCRVDLILQFQSSSSRLPYNLTAAMPQIIQLMPENRGVMLLVGADYYIRATFSIAQNSAPHRFGDVYCFDTIEDAYALLEFTPVEAARSA
jgi:hypothetical protein